MNVFLIVVFCLQQQDLALDKTCVTKIHKNPYSTMEECIISLREVNKASSEIPNLHTTGFCTTKDIQNI